MEEYSHTFETKDGIVIRVRSLEPDDVPHLVDIFENMGQESRYSRFNMALANPDQETIQKEAAEMVDFERPANDGWLAFADLPGKPNTPVAGIRYVHTSEGEAEVAVSVRDDMQNKGIGTSLLTFLFEQAKQAGIHKLVAYAQRNNRPLLRILSKSVFPVRRIPDGSDVYFEVDL